MLMEGGLLHVCFLFTFSREQLTGLRKITTATLHLCEQPVDNERITIAANRDKI